MGCVNSNAAAKGDGAGGAAGGHGGDGHGGTGEPNSAGLGGSPRSSKSPLSAAEIRQRIECCDRQIELPMAHFKLRFAFLSQRGYYPDSPDKPNQDAFCVHTNFTGDENQALFAVFDGHGKEGHFCAQFARDHLPDRLRRRLRANEDIKASLNNSHVECNAALHSEPTVDDSLSGTTSISLYLNGRHMYVANVGDSRAILAQRVGNRLVAKPLSYDQTPYRKDERERVKKCGARVLSMDQIEGLEPIHENWGDVNLGEELDEGGDPPRIWAPNGEYPGTAFTRSIGDAIAEQLGVSAVPEITDREVGTNDVFIVIASDGVFEFLTNQNVVDLVANYEDPLEACRAVVSEAYELWLQYEIRTDDISMICIYLDDIKSKKGQRKSLALDEIKLQGARPVRRTLSRESRRYIIPAADEPEDEQDVDWEAMRVEKSEAELRRIDEATRSTFLFQHLNTEQKMAVFSVMQKMEVNPGDWIIRQGDAGDQFYVVDSGKYQVRVQREGEDPREDGGDVVFEYDGRGCFGELALMYSKPRAASIITRSRGVLWGLDRRVFRSIIMRSKDKRRDIIRTLLRVSVFRALSVHQIQRLCDILAETTYNRGDTIIRQGDEGDTFFVISSGSVQCSVRQASGEDKTVLSLNEHDYFGERALISNEPRAATVTAASERVHCLYIDRRAFEEVLGPLSKIIDDDRRRREARVASNPVIFNSTDQANVTACVHEDSLGAMATLIMAGPAPDATLRVYNKTAVEELEEREAVLRAAATAKAVTSEILQATMRMSMSSRHLRSDGDCPSLPLLTRTYNEENALHLLFATPVACDLLSLVEEGPLPEHLAVHIGACALTAVNLLHESSVIYRNISSEMLFLDMRGHLLLMDYRSAKIGLDKTYTLCGDARYLAPEQVAQTGHSSAVDFWAIGVLLFELTTGISPFALDDGTADDEVVVYQQISGHARGSLRDKYPPQTSAEFKDLLDGLLEPDPAQRLGCGGRGFQDIEAHPWFNGVNWNGLRHGSDDPSPLQEFVQRIFESKRTAGLGVDQLTKPYNGDSAWASEF